MLPVTRDHWPREFCFDQYLGCSLLHDFTIYIHLYYTEKAAITIGKEIFTGFLEVLRKVNEQQNKHEKARN